MPFVSWMCVTFSSESCSSVATIIRRLSESWCLVTSKVRLFVYNVCRLVLQRVNCLIYPVWGQCHWLFFLYLLCLFKPHRLLWQIIMQQVISCWNYACTCLKCSITFVYVYFRILVACCMVLMTSLFYVGHIYRFVLGNLVKILTEWTFDMGKVFSTIRNIQPSTSCFILIFSWGFSQIYGVRKNPVNLVISMFLEYLLCIHLCWSKK